MYVLFTKVGIVVFFFLRPVSFFFKIFLINLFFRQRGREGQKEGEKYQCVVASHAPPTGDLAHNQGMCPDWELNWQPFGLQASTQSTELHQPRPLVGFLPPLCRTFKKRFLRISGL